MDFFSGSLIYVFFGTIKEVSIGPTSLMSLVGICPSYSVFFFQYSIFIIKTHCLLHCFQFQLTLQYTADKPPEFAIILAFLAGCVELAMGVLKLGKCCSRLYMISIYLIWNCFLTQI